MREHFSIEREDSQTEPRHNGPLGRPALQVRDLRVSSHKIPSAHFLHPDSTLESLIRERRIRTLTAAARAPDVSSPTREGYPMRSIVLSGLPIAASTVASTAGLRPARRRSASKNKRHIF